MMIPEQKEEWGKCQIRSNEDENEEKILFLNVGEKYLNKYDGAITIVKFDSQAGYSYIGDDDRSYTSTGYCFEDVNFDLVQKL